MLRDFQCGFKRARGLIGGPQAFSPEHLEEDVAFTEMGWTGRNCFGGRLRSFVLDVFQCLLGTQPKCHRKSRCAFTSFSWRSTGREGLSFHFPHPSLLMGTSSWLGSYFTAHTDRALGVPGAPHSTMPMLRLPCSLQTHSLPFPSRRRFCCIIPPNSPYLCVPPGAASPWWGTLPATMRLSCSTE